MAPIVAIADARKVLLDLARIAPLDATHDIAIGMLGRDRKKHVVVIAPKNALDYLDVQLRADLPNDLANTKLEFTNQHVVAVFGRPCHVIAVLETRYGHFFFTPKRFV